MPEDEEFAKEQIDELCRKLFGILLGPHMWESVFPSNSDHYEMFRKLFIWALLTERWKLAEVFWRYGPEPIATALVGGVLIRVMAKVLRGNDVLEDRLKTLRAQETYTIAPVVVCTSQIFHCQVCCRKWGKLGFQLLQACYVKNRDLAEILVTTISERWHDQTPLKLAVAHRNKQFTGHAAVQTVLSRTWMGRMEPRTLTAKVRSSGTTEPRACMLGEQEGK